MNTLAKITFAALLSITAGTATLTYSTTDAEAFYGYGYGGSYGHKSWKIL